MPDPNGNLSAAERAALPEGARVSYRRRNDTFDRVGTVESSTDLGTIALYCGSTVLRTDYCHLISEHCLLWPPTEHVAPAPLPAPPAADLIDRLRQKAVALESEAREIRAAIAAWEAAQQVLAKAVS